MSGYLSPCPAFCTCVSSREDAARRHRIEPFDASEDPDAAFARLKRLVADTPRTRIATVTDEYLHARCRTRVGFVDDLEFLLCRRQALIHVRSASRIYVAWDLGVNRRRVERLRRRFEGREDAGRTAMSVGRGQDARQRDGRHLAGIAANVRPPG